MARALVVAVACALATSAADYGEYSGARMPHYRMDYDGHDPAGRDLYPERSPDAPVSLDYKYEEDASGNLVRTTENTIDESDTGLRTKKKRNKLLDVEHDYNEVLDKYSNSENRERNVKSNRVQLRNRSNFKRKKFDIEVEPVPERERRKYDDFNIASRESIQQLGEDRFINSRHAEKKYRNNGEGRDPRRSGRRKPRDRSIDPNLDDSNEGILSAERVFDTDESVEEEVADIVGHRRSEPGRARGTRPDADFSTKSKVMRPDKSYSDYDEYEDMQRVLNIRNKLPSLLRRTKASYSTTESTAPFEEWFRRANIPDKQEKTTSRTTKAPATKSLKKLRSTVITTVKTIATTTAATSPKTPPTTTIPSSTSELSLAEKSRLSILKKAQRKESLNSGTITTKPPVLMQVSQRMQTLVMVEPGNSEVERLQAREISDDSPERLAKAKRLMRHKLLSNAKSIHDLTDNWDDVVCDYIDVSLLSLAPAPHGAPPPAVALAVTLMCQILLIH